MVRLSQPEIGELLAPFLGSPANALLCEQIGWYLELLDRWNRKVSLTSVRDSRGIVQRHFGESLFLAERLPAAGTLLDVGSGAGFPGIPVALLRPELQVTLAESQGKKAAFLREAVAELNLDATVWAGRVESMPDSQRFEVVTLRAVDRMEAAMQLAMRRVGPDGTLAFLAGAATPVVSPEGWEWKESPLPLFRGRLIVATAPLL